MAIILNGASNLSSTTAEFDATTEELAGLKLGEQVKFSYTNKKLESLDTFFNHGRAMGEYYKPPGYNPAASTYYPLSFVLGDWHVLLYATQMNDSSYVTVGVIADDITGSKPKVEGSFKVPSTLGSGNSTALTFGKVKMNDERTIAVMEVNIDSEVSSIIYFKLTDPEGNLTINDIPLAGDITLGVATRFEGLYNLGSYGRLSIEFKDPTTLLIMHCKISGSGIVFYTLDLTTGGLSGGTSISTGLERVGSDGLSSFLHLYDNVVVMLHSNKLVRVDLDTNTILHTSTGTVSVAPGNKNVNFERISDTEAFLLCGDYSSTTDNYRKMYKISYSNTEVEVLDTIEVPEVKGNAGLYTHVVLDDKTMLIKEKNSSAIGLSSMIVVYDIDGGLVYKQGTLSFGQSINTSLYTCSNLNVDKKSGKLSLTMSYGPGYPKYYKALVDIDDYLSTFNLTSRYDTRFISPTIGTVVEVKNSSVVVDTSGYGLLVPTLNNLDEVGLVYADKAVSLGSDFIFVSKERLKEYKIYSTLESTGNTDSLGVQFIYGSSYYLESEHDVDVIEKGGDIKITIDQLGNAAENTFIIVDYIPSLFKGSAGIRYREIQTKGERDMFINTYSSGGITITVEPKA